MSESLPLSCRRIVRACTLGRGPFPPSARGAFRGRSPSPPLASSGHKRYSGRVPFGAPSARLAPGGFPLFVCACRVCGSPRRACWLLVRPGGPRPNCRPVPRRAQGARCFCPCARRVPWRCGPGGPPVGSPCPRRRLKWFRPAHERVAAWWGPRLASRGGSPAALGPGVPPGPLSRPFLGVGRRGGLSWVPLSPCSRVPAVRPVRGPGPPGGPSAWASPLARRPGGATVGPSVARPGAARPSGGVPPRARAG